MADGPRKASIRPATMMERIQTGVADALGLGSWDGPSEAPSVEAATIARRDALDTPVDRRSASMRAPTVMERIRETLQPVTSAIEAVGTPFDNAEMGPAKAITLVTKKPLTELLKKLHPRDFVGRMVDPSEFPNIVNAVQEGVETVPRIASHLNSVNMDLSSLDGTMGLLDIPDRFRKQMKAVGPSAFKEQPVARMRLSPSIENLEGSLSPRDTVFHEMTHLAQFLADPTRFNPTYEKAYGNIMRMVPPRWIPEPAGVPRGLGFLPYQFNPAEVGARATAARKTSGNAIPYGDAVARELQDVQGVDRDYMTRLWQRARTQIK